MDWKSDTTYQKLTLAAMLHDLPISNQDLARIDSLKELESKKGQFTPKEIDSFKTHSDTAAKLARSMNDIPPDVDVILLEHHERPDGEGFPRKISSSRIGALSVIFIVAHDLVRFILDQGDGTEIKPTLLKEFAEKQKEVYVHGGFKKALRVITDLGSSE
jgi:response regulator RpfG family c-di-GMP phosphodiesterase